MQRCEAAGASLAWLHYLRHALVSYLDGRCADLIVSQRMLAQDSRSVPRLL